MYTITPQPVAAQVKASVHVPFKPCPAEVDRHRWVFYAAHQCKKAAIPDTEAIELIEGHLTRDPSPPNEVATTVQKVYNSTAAAAAPRWPARNEERIAERSTNGCGVKGLEDLSPWKAYSETPQTEEIVDAIFPPHALLCCGMSSSRFSTRNREEWRGKLETRQLIVPSPMSALMGLTQGGKPSAHSLQNTGPRRFQVVEFDKGTPDGHANTLLHLVAYLPLTLVVHSGGKSLHGWYYCAGEDEEQVFRFMRYAVSLGADRATWTRSQFVRMPDGLRDTGVRQRVLYFNPQTVGGAL